MCNPPCTATRCFACNVTAREAAIMVAGMVWQSHPWTSPQAMVAFMDAVLNAASRSVDPQIFEERS